MVKNNDYSVILCVGDSITEANHCSEGHPGYVALFDEALRLACTRNKFVVINAGIGGAKARQSVDFVSGLVKRFKPSLTTVMYGMNDCAAGMEQLDEFFQAITAMVNVIRENDSEVVLLTQNPLDYACNIKTIQRRPCLPGYMDAVRNCAKELNVELVDINAAWQHDILDSDNNEHYKLMHDGAHPNQHGHRFMFEQIKQQLMD